MLSTSVLSILPTASLSLPPCRSVGEFWQAKHKTAQALAEVVCEAGWSLDGTSARGIADSFMLAFSQASAAGFNASTWVVAAISAQMQDEGTLVTAGGPAAPPAASDQSAALIAYNAVARSRSCSVLLHELGHPDAAADLPPHYELLFWLSW